MVYTHARRHDDFKAAWDEALELCADRVERALVKRGIEGVEETVFGRLAGKNTGNGPIGKRRVYSDTAAIFWLKGNRPEKFRDSEQRVTIGGAVQHQHEHWVQLLQDPRLFEAAHAIARSIESEELAGLKALPDAENVTISNGKTLDSVRQGTPTDNRQETPDPAGEVIDATSTTEDPRETPHPKD